MNDNRISLFFKKYGGLVIGIIIGLIILNFQVLYDLFKFILVIGVCAWIGNYIHTNRLKVKEFLKKLVDRI